VKFARLRPTAGEATAFLRDTRALLTDWRDALGRGALEHGALASGAPAAAEKTRAIR
jgi:hypothetical protein